MRWRLRDDELDIELTVPYGSIAELVLPDGAVEVLDPGDHRRSAPYVVPTRSAAV